MPSQAPESGESVVSDLKGNPNIAAADSIGDQQQVESVAAETKKETPPAVLNISVQDRLFQESSHPQPPIALSAVVVAGEEPSKVTESVALLPEEPRFKKSLPVQDQPQAAGNQEESVLQTRSIPESDFLPGSFHDTKLQGQTGEQVAKVKELAQVSGT